MAEPPQRRVSSPMNMSVKAFGPNKAPWQWEGGQKRAMGKDAESRKLSNDAPRANMLMPARA